MKQGVAENCWSGMRPLELLLMRDERDTHGSGTVELSLCLRRGHVMSMWGKAALFYHFRSIFVLKVVIMLLCVFARRLP